MLEEIRKSDKDWRIYLIMIVVFALDYYFSPESDMLQAVVIILTICLIVLRKEIRLDWGDMIIFLCMGSMDLIIDGELFEAVYEGLCAMFVYQLGKNLTYIFDNDQNDTDPVRKDTMDRVSFAVIIISLVLFCRGILCYAYCFVDTTSLDAGEWAMWSWKTPTWNYIDGFDTISHEACQAYSVIMGSLLVYHICSIRKSRIYGIIGTILSLVAIIIGFFTPGALSAVCCLGTFIIVAVAYIIERKAYRNMKLWLVTGAVIDAITAFVVAVKLNLFGLGRWYGSYIWSAADSEFYDIRFTVWGQVFGLLGKYPMGDSRNELLYHNVRHVYHAYNSWLETAAKTGIIPFVLSVAFLAMSIAAVRYVWANIRSRNKYVLICAFTAMTIYSMLVNAATAYTIFWYIYIFLTGLAMGIYAGTSGKEGLVISPERIRRLFIKHNIDTRKVIFCIIIVMFSCNMAITDDRSRFWWMVVLIWSCLVVMQQKITLDIGDVLIFSGMFTFRLFQHLAFWPALVYALQMTAMYQTGKYAIFYASRIPQGKSETCRTQTPLTMRLPAYGLIVFAAAVFVRGLFNYSYLILYHDKALSSAGTIESWPVWGNWDGSPVARTLHEFFLIPMGCLLIFWILIMSRKTVALAVTGIILSCLAIYLGVYSEGRETFFCTAVAAFIVIVAYSVEKKLYRRRWLQITAGTLAALAAVVIMVIKLNIGGIGDAYEESGLYAFGNILHNIRFELWRWGLSCMKRYPMGRCDETFLEPDFIRTPYAHNSWLDIGKSGGIIPFVLTCAFTVTNIYSLIYACRRKSGVFKYALVAVFAAVTAQNMFEPGIVADFAYKLWGTEVFLAGMTNGLYVIVAQKAGMVLGLSTETVSHTKEATVLT